MDLSFLKQAYEDKCIEIDGRNYVFGTAQHAQRKRVFGYLSSIAGRLQKNDLSFITEPECAEVEKVIGSIVTFDGLQLNKRPNHWDEYPEDYLVFLPLAMGVLSYPFLRGKLGGLAYQQSLQANQAQ